VPGQNEKDFVEDLKNQFEYLRQERKKREGDWKEVQKYVASSVFNWDNPLEKIPIRPQRYTSRPTHYLKTLVSGITGYSISPNIVWHKLSLEDIDMLDRYGVKDWLEQVERILYAEFRRSNLYQQTSKFVEYSATYGHALMLIDEQLQENRLRFTTHKISEVYIETDEYEEVGTVFRHFSMTLKNMAAFFGEENLSVKRKEELKDKKKWHNEFTILHAVYRRETFDKESPGNKNMPYASIYIDESEDSILLESGYQEFPYAVLVWENISGTAYGESPAIYALDDIKLLNKIDEARIKIAQMAAEPPMNVPDTLRGEENVVPRGYNYYTKPDEIMTPIQTGTNFPITLEINNSIENRVRDWFNVDFFLMLQHENQNKQMTATEVVELQGEKAAILSDLVVKLNSALTKIIQRSFTILYRQGKIPQPPVILMGSGAQMKVDFTGPLAQAQKKYHETNGIAQAINLVGAVGNLTAEALDVVDFDQLIKRGMEGAGVSQFIIREDDDIAKIRQARAEQQAQAQQQAAAMEQQKNIMGNMNKLNEPVKQGSPLEELNKQMAG